jgi:23S rRNA (cytosine1962-C5)-methyltransferase
MQDYIKIILKSGKDQSLKRLHPWVFSGAIKKILGNPEEGDAVSVYSNRDEYLGVGHYQKGTIAVRMLSATETKLDQEFWNRRIQQAVSYRRHAGLIGNRETNVFRIINAEGDQLPGLIADYYNGTVVIQFHSAGMYRVTDQIVTALQGSLQGMITAVYIKTEGTLPDRTGAIKGNGYLYKERDQQPVMEYGNTFLVDCESGQKTGFYIDQRENRKLVEGYSSGREVLNLFGYTGGFSVYALRGGALRADTVDSSARAVQMAEQNALLNGYSDKVHHAVEADAFDYMEEIRDRYDLIIIDPPAFAKHQHALNNALQGYKRINAKAIEQIRPGGIIFTFSCSQAVSRENFRKSVFAAAAGTGRMVRIIRQLYQPPDHPVSIYHPEGEYLKGLVLYVGDY